MKQVVKTHGGIKTMTEKEKMLAGKIYDPSDDELVTLRAKAHDICREYNSLSETDAKKEELMQELFGEKIEAYLQGPIQFDYGRFTKIGKGSYANFNFTVLDCAPVIIGENVFIGPNVSLLTPVHPFRFKDRNMYINAAGKATDKEYARKIVIEDNCWIAGNVTVCGGVTIGSGSVIGAGSVVTRDIPSNVIAAGNPCRVIREITEDDDLENHPELF